ncbi:ATP-dependent DNA helicase [Georgenia sp. MJ173]|uniref:ATP-dependent DNA helicase n=1 Tax=Georgenia sunbinii TaxID=3117728 RepID=UPI002F26BF93
MSQQTTLLAPTGEPATPSPVLLDADQQRVVSAVPGQGHLLVVGAPGTGKTTTAVETLVARARAAAPQPRSAHPLGGAALFLAPSRRAADRVRDTVGARLLGTGGAAATVRSVAAIAYAVVRARAAMLRLPPPALITGPQQDAILADLLAGHREGHGRDPRWPESVGPQARQLPAFRAELRDLLTRAVELGLSPAELAGLGRRSGRPEWVSAATVLEEYVDVTTLSEGPHDRGARYDVAAIVDVATQALRTWRRDLPGAEPPRWGTVVVDDYQDATLATARLLGALADDGAELVLLGDPDAGVQGFRGGTPALVGRATTREAIGGFDARQEVLTTVWRGDRQLREVVARVTAPISVVGGARHRRAAAAGPASTSRPAGAEVTVLRSESQQAAHVARRLREEHLHHGTPWSQMAVVVRSAAQVTGLRRMLREAGVPVTHESGQRALHTEPAVRPLLAALQVAVGDDLDAERAVALLCSPIGAMDAVSLRALRRALRGAAAAGLPESSAPVAVRAAVDEYLVELLGEPAAAAELPTLHRAGPQRVSQVLAAGRRAVTDGAGATAALWAVWQAAGLARPWRQRALAGGPAGVRADADLDAVVALFRAAEQFDERQAGAGPGGFVAELLAQDIAADTLARRAQHRESVAVLTPAATEGDQWEVVVIAGLQEDVWPDLRLRDTLLGAGVLAEIGSGRRAADAAADRRQARRDVLDDELRMLAVAVSRASRRLVATAVLDLEQRPSSFLELLDPAGEGAVERRVHDVPPALDLRGLVAELRAALDTELAGTGPDQQRLTVAASLLSRLAAERVAGAAPEEWAGLSPATTTEPLRAPDEQVVVSPSSVESADRCPLRWALQAGGGQREDTMDQSLGTLVHEIAEQHPGGTADELHAALEERWAGLGVGDGWVGRALHDQARAMVDRLAHYVAGVPGPVTVEAEFLADVGRARLKGRIDRIEELAAEPREVRVVDLKTSKNPVSVEDGHRNPQLATYQVAIDAGGLGEGTTSAGGRLVYLGTGSTGPAAREQVAMGSAEDPAWGRELVGRVAETMAGGEFEARRNPGCSYCPVRRSCPLQTEGKQVAQ